MIKNIVLGMSGGVDSSVCAWVLKQQGYDVTGVFMKNWEDDGEEKHCSWEKDFADVRSVCDTLDIPYYTVNFEKEYRDYVFDYFLSEYKEGRTPNPDVICNTEIKFKAFLNYALKIDADAIAMGHYARVEKKDGLYFLKRGADKSKDQSYFLSRIGQNALSKVIFPIGDMQKKQVRQIAHQLDLTTAEKKDSTGICFIGERNFNNFLSKYLKAENGSIVNIDTLEKIGEHTGLINYTLGQRKGIGIGGVGSGEPFFVCGKNLGENILYVCQGADHEALFSKSMIGKDVFWNAKIPSSFPFKCTAKFRYRQQDINVSVMQKGNDIIIEYDFPVKAVTPGQIAVLYDGEYCLGSAVISKICPVNPKYEFLNKNVHYDYVKQL